MRTLVPLAHVRDVRRSTAFYQLLGFDVANTHTPDGGSDPVWAWLRSADAHLMLAQAGEPIVEPPTAALFYLYCDDVTAFRAMLQERGVDAGPVAYPFYAPRGEFKVIDPDGYVLMVSHT